MTLILLDGILIILLLFGIKAVVEFYEKYKEFLALKEELKGVLRHVQHAMKIAHETVDTLQKNITLASTHITPHLPKAQTLKEDLEFLTEHGVSLADRLENLTRDIKQNQLRPKPQPSYNGHASDHPYNNEKETSSYRRASPSPTSTKRDYSEKDRSSSMSRYSMPKDYESYDHRQDEREEAFVERKGFVTTIRRAR